MSVTDVPGLVMRAGLRDGGHPRVRLEVLGGRPPHTPLFLQKSAQGFDGERVAGNPVFWRVRK